LGSKSLSEEASVRSLLVESPGIQNSNKTKTTLLVIVSSSTELKESIGWNLISPLHCLNFLPLLLEEPEEDPGTSILDLIPKTIEMVYKFDQFGKTVSFSGRFDFPDDVVFLCLFVVIPPSWWLAPLGGYTQFTRFEGGNEVENWQERRAQQNTHKRASSTEPNTKDSSLTQSAHLRI
jgi:hypothetical protein